MPLKNSLSKSIFFVDILHFKKSLVVTKTIYSKYKGRYRSVTTFKIVLHFLMYIDSDAKQHSCIVLRLSLYVHIVWRPAVKSDSFCLFTSLSARASGAICMIAPVLFYPLAILCYKRKVSLCLFRSNPLEKNKINVYRARICKRLRSPDIDSKESIPPAHVAWRAAKSNRLVVPGPPGWESIPGLLTRFTKVLGLSGNPLSL
jgi:hypothetical protein